MSGLRAALGIGRSGVVAVVGAGGKTTLVYGLASEANARGLRVLVTTTTHMGTLPGSVTGPVFVLEDARPLDRLDEALRVHGRATLLGRRIRDDKIEGVPPGRVDELAERADLTLVEADGARQRSLKLPAAHEPVIPHSARLVVVVAALDILGQPLTEARVHRLELVTAATGRPEGTLIDVDLIAAALAHPGGYPSRVPPAARSAVFLNQAEGAARLAAAESLARRLRPPYDLVAAGSASTGQARTWP